MAINPKLKEMLDSSGIDLSSDRVDKAKFESFLEVVNNEYSRQEEEVEKLKVVLDTNPCTISWVNKDMTYAGVNKTLADICNLPAENFPGQTIGYYTEDKYFYNFTKKLFENDEVTHYEELHTNINGADKKYWVVGTRFHQDSQAVIIGMDITELKSMESTISLMEKLSSLGEMVASIIHEVNNPLAMIKLQSMSIKKLLEKEKYDKVLETADKIDQTTERISKLIVGIKSFVRRGDSDPQQQSNLADIIADAHVICEGRLKENDIEFRFDKENSNVDMVCNVTHIFQVFVNLITNSADAIKHRDKKWIEIKVAKADNETTVTFTDSGNGIDKNVASKIFDNFYTTKEVGKGTGIGLALSRKIMESHNGSIELDTNASNTTFILKFSK